MRRSKVYVHFPKTGLGNMLLTWSRGFVFAKLNDLPLITSGWAGIRWGAWIRRERKKRIYWGYFKEDSWLERFKIAFQRSTFEKITEPEVARIEPKFTKTRQEAANIEPEAGTIIPPENKRILFVFDQVSSHQDLFGPLRPHRSLIRTGILEMLTPTTRKRLEGYAAPAISVHIRRGDFKIGNPITPSLFFIDAIQKVRQVTGQEWPVTVFTDASPEEIQDVLALPGVSLTEDKPDILDILLMSKSMVIVISRSSTFSYWGAFLSDAIVIKPEGDWQDDLRPREVNEKIFEGKVDFKDLDSVGKLETALKNHKWQRLRNA